MAKLYFRAKELNRRVFYGLFKREMTITEIKYWLLKTGELAAALYSARQKVIHRNEIERIIKSLFVVLGIHLRRARKAPIWDTDDD